MAFDPTLADPTSRLRFDLGDTATVALLPDATYTAVLARHTAGDPAVTDEQKATRDLARALAARYAIEPDSISADGSKLTWGERVAQWNLIAQGLQGGSSAKTARGFTITRGPARDYTTGAGDAS